MHEYRYNLSLQFGDGMGERANRKRYCCPPNGVTCRPGLWGGARSPFAARAQASLREAPPGWGLAPGGGMPAPCWILSPWGAWPLARWANGSVKFLIASC